MDLREIRNLSLYGMSKQEIINFIQRVCSELNMVMEIDSLKSILNNEQMQEVESALEKDTRDSIDRDNPGEFTEEEVKEYIESDREGRRFQFKTNDEGKLVFVDVDSRMEDYSEIGTYSFENADMLSLVEAFLDTIDYNIGNNSNEFMRDNGMMLQELSDKFKPFKDVVRDIESIKRRLNSDHEPDINTLLETMRLTGASLNVNELSTIVNSNAASITKLLRVAEANQRFTANENFTEEQVQRIRDKYVARDIYYVAMQGNRLSLSPMSEDLPRLDFDDEKMSEPEFKETILASLGRGKDIIDGRFSGFFAEELKGLIDLAVTSRTRDTNDFDLKSYIENIAKDPDVVKEFENAKEAMDKVMDKEEPYKENEGQEIDF